MNKRIAKKVIRNYYNNFNRHFWDSYSYDTFYKAMMTINKERRLRWRFQRTCGNRFGKFDPALPSDPNDLPF